MTVNLSDAVSAYQRLVQGEAEAGLAARDDAGEGDFAGALRAATETAVGSLRAGETESLKAAAGKADINEVVMAVSQAEITLQTVVAVRDRVIQAYQEILRMPI